MRPQDPPAVGPMCHCDLIAKVEERFSGWMAPEEVASQMELVRADERWERLERIIEAGRVAEATRRETRTDLRDKVEALNGILTAKFDGGQDVLLWRSEVIALLKEEDDE